MGSGGVVEAFPYIVDVVEQLIEFLLVSPTGAFDLAVEWWRARLDVDVTNALVFDVPLKLGIELEPAIGSDAL
jgi:hypothetical protein